MNRKGMQEGGTKSKKEDGERAVRDNGVVAFIRSIGSGGEREDGGRAADVDGWVVHTEVSVHREISKPNVCFFSSSHDYLI